MKYASFAFVLGLMVTGLVSRPALAATPTASFSVTATVLASCQVSTPATAFGGYTAAGVNAISPVSMTCTNPIPYTVSLSAGLTTEATRKMTDPAAAWLGYALLPDSAHTIKGRRSVGTSTVAGTANASSQPQAVYGQTAGTQYVAPGAFADAITVSVTY